SSPNSDGFPMTTEQISSLESQLREKEQLVTALTERLEQAADQLDRIRRNGGDRVLRGGGGGLPPELIEEQRALTTALQHAVEQWEAAQPGAALGRIEVQIRELRDLVTNGMPEGGYSAAPREEAHHAGREASAPSRPKSGAMSSYEAMKAQYMDAPA